MEKHYGGISHTFVNAMFGIILVIGFLDWMGISNTLQYALFIFTFILATRHWISRSSRLKRFPPKNISGVLMDVTAMFIIFLIIKAASLNIGFYFASLAVLRAIDALGISRMLSDYVLTRVEKIRFNAMRWIYFLEASIYILFEVLSFNYGLPNVFGITALILVWLFGRVSEYEI